MHVAPHQGATWGLLISRLVGVEVDRIGATVVLVINSEQAHKHVLRGGAPVRGLYLACPVPL
jgi:hypothetical protein